MNPRSLLKAKSFAVELQKVCDERGITLYELSLKIGVDKATIYRLHKQEWVQIKTVVAIANALNLQYKIDNKRNVTFVKDENRSSSEYEPHRISVLRKQLKQELEELEPDSIESLGEIIRNLKVKHGSKTQNPVEVER